MRSPVDLGFTGSQHGMSLRTKQSFITVISSLAQENVFRSDVTAFRHGDCIGADVEASGIAAYWNYLVHAHPCFIEKKRAFSPYNDIIHAPKHPLERNRDIVDLSAIMIATPYTMQEVIRSGTWTTIRYARKLERELCIIFPDGSVEWENSDRSYGREATRA